MHERHARSAAKGISWRLFATLDTLILAYLFTGSLTLAGAIGGFEVLTKVLWYYLHERAWLALPHERFHPRVAPHFHPRAPTRSVLKALTWRLVGAIDTMLISLVVTGRLAVSLSIGGAELFTKMLLYFLHERLWLNVEWGTGRAEPEHPHLRAAIEHGLASIRRLGAAALYAILCILFLVAMAAITHALR